MLRMIIPIANQKAEHGGERHSSEDYIDLSELVDDEFVSAEEMFREALEGE